MRTLIITYHYTNYEELLTLIFARKVESNLRSIYV